MYPIHLSAGEFPDKFEWICKIAVGRGGGDLSIPACIHVPQFEAWETRDPIQLNGSLDIRSRKLVKHWTSTLTILHAPRIYLRTGFPELLDKTYYLCRLVLSGGAAFAVRMAGFHRLMRMRLSGWWGMGFSGWWRWDSATESARLMSTAGDASAELLQYSVVSKHLNRIFFVKKSRLN